MNLLINCRAKISTKLIKLRLHFLFTCLKYCLHLTQLLICSLIILCQSGCDGTNFSFECFLKGFKFFFNAQIHLVHASLHFSDVIFLLLSWAKQVIDTILVPLGRLFNSRNWLSSLLQLISCSCIKKIDVCFQLVHQNLVSLHCHLEFLCSLINLLGYLCISKFLERSLHILYTIVEHPWLLLHFYNSRSMIINMLNTKLLKCRILLLWSNFFSFVLEMLLMDLSVHCCVLFLVFIHCCLKLFS